MRKVLVGILFLGTILISAPGNSVATAIKGITVGDYCTASARMASVVMKARQAGVSLPDVLGLCETVLCRAFALAAYKEPLFLTPEVQERTITEFENRAMLECLDDWQRWLQLEKGYKEEQGKKKAI